MPPVWWSGCWPVVSKTKRDLTINIVGAATVIPKPCSVQDTPHTHTQELETIHSPFV